MRVARKEEAPRGTSAENTHIFAQLIVEADLRTVNSDITQKNFCRTKRSRVIRPETEALSLSDLVMIRPATLDLLRELRRRNLRPARLVELLDYAKTGWDGNGVVVALESTWQSARTGRCYVPCLVGNNGGRDLCLRRGHMLTRWESDCRFLATACRHIK